MPAATEHDYYAILGVSRTASQDEIRKAYLKLAHQYHPDKTGGDKASEDKLKRINEAYDTLKNAEKRKQYDDSLKAAEFNPFHGGGGFEGGFDYETADLGGDSPFEDLLGSLFGRHGPRGRRAQPGRDVETTITLTLNEVATGVTRTIRIGRHDTCGVCGGSGAAPGATPQPCPTCGGSGRLERAGGAFNLTQTCPRCAGTGRIVSTPCPRCAGSGLETVDRELSVRVPPGIQAGARLRVSGEGEPGAHGGPRGDLYLRVAIAPHPYFTRDGANLVCEVPVPFTTAALGGKVRVPTLTGAADLTVPAGTQNGATLRMRGLGIASPHAARGDELVRVTVEVPENLTREQRELIKTLAQSGDGHHYPKSTAYANKLRRH